MHEWVFQGCMSAVCIQVCIECLLWFFVYIFVVYLLINTGLHFVTCAHTHIYMYSLISSGFMIIIFTL